MLWTGFIKNDQTTGGNVTKMARGERLRLTDIICRLISTDGVVELNERIWMNKLCDHNNHAKELMCGIISEDKVD